MKEAGWVVEYKERHRVDASWKLFAVWDGDLDTKEVGQRLEDMGMKVSVSNEGKFIEASDGMDDFRVRRQM